MENVTVKQVIEISANELKGLNVPVNLIPTIGMTLSRVVANLEVCLKAIDEAEKREREPVSENGEENFKIVPMSDKGGGPDEEN